MPGKIKNMFFIPAVFIFCLSGIAGADDLRGYFPLYNGRFWNFTEAPGSATVTWAVNGCLTLKDAGRVTLMALDDGRFLCVREDWDGINIYGDYSAEKYFVPEKPLLFLPSSLKPGQPLEVAVTLKVFSDPEGNINFKETGKINQKITFLHKEYEDVTAAGQVFKNCAVVEKTTIGQDAVTTETLYLAPGIGPVKRVLKTGQNITTYTLASRNCDAAKAETFAVKDLLPFAPGITWTYKDQKGTIWHTTTKAKETIEGTASLPFAEETGDIYYYTLDQQGLLLIRKYWALVGGCTDFHAPDAPLQVFPPLLTLGSYYSSTSNARVHTWPSMTLMEEFYPEMLCANIAVVKEDVSVPAGTYRNCLKVCQFFVSRNFNMNNEQVRIGYIWLAKDAGVIKKELIDLTNYFNPLRINRMTSIKFWDLIKLNKKGG